MRTAKLVINMEVVRPERPWIIIIPDVIGSGAAVSEAVRNNWNVVVVIKPHWRVSTPMEGVAAVIEATFIDDANVIELEIEQLISQFELSHAQPFATVVAFSEGAVLVAASLRERFCGEINGLNKAVPFRDKWIMKNIAREAGIAVADYAIASDRLEVERLLTSCASEQFVVKPRMGCASSGVMVFDSPHEVLRYLESVESSMHDDLLLEVFVDGDLFHVDSILHEGYVHWYLCFKYETSLLEVSSRERRYFLDITAPPELQYSLRDFNFKVLAALGLGSGLSHTEIFRERDSGRLVLCEAACRPPGAGVVLAHQVMRGVSSFSSWVRLCACAHSSDGGTKSNNDVVAILTILSNPGVVKRADNLAEIKSEQIVATEMYAHEGSFVQGRGYLGAIGSAVIRGKTRDEVMAVVDSIVRQYNFEIEEHL